MNLESTSSALMPNNFNVSYETEYTALVTADSRQELLTWWNKNKNNEPFSLFVADRMNEPNMTRLRVRLEHQNQKLKIRDIFNQAQIKYDNAPPSVLSQIKYIRNNLDKNYEIQGKSYRIERLISAKGCYGDVFLACDVDTENKVAIKILRIQEDKEDQMLKKLARHGNHPNVVKYIGSDIKGLLWNTLTVRLLATFLGQVTWKDNTKVL